jgi:hypothetical protein
MADGFVGPNLIELPKTLFEVSISDLNNVSATRYKARPICLLNGQLWTIFEVRHSDVKAQRRQMFDGISEATVNQHNIASPQDLHECCPNLFSNGRIIDIGFKRANNVNDVTIRGNNHHRLE